jgi:hypothetical protein
LQNVNALWLFRIWQQLAIGHKMLWVVLALLVVKYCFHFACPVFSLLQPVLPKSRCDHRL